MGAIRLGELLWKRSRINTAHSKIKCGRRRRWLPRRLWRITCPLARRIRKVIYPRFFLVKSWSRAVHMNSGQGPSGMTNPLIGMKNLGDYILDAGWGSLGAWAGIKALYEASKSNGGKLAGFVADIASGGTYGIAHGAVGGVLSAIG